MKYIGNIVIDIFSVDLEIHILYPEASPETL
jgi:hypothetical protein